MLVQVALTDIGQLTDMQETPSRGYYRTSQALSRTQRGSTASDNNMRHTGQHRPPVRFARAPCRIYPHKYTKIMSALKI
jgi:hypothetical protein